MAVYVDVQGVQSKDHGERGIARYILETSKSLTVDHPGVVDAFTVNPYLAVPFSLEPLLAAGRLHPQPAIRPLPGDVLHVASPFEMHVPMRQLWPSAFRHSGVRLAVTLYDLIPLLQRELYLADRQTALTYESRLQLVRSADLLLCISESTAQDAVSHLGIAEDRIRVVHAGVQPAFSPARDRAATTSAAREAVPGLRDEFVLYTGGLDLRKNVEGLLRAWSGLPASLRSDHQLVVVCRATHSELSALEKMTRSLGIFDHVLFTGFVSDATLVTLYQAAHLFVFPSLYEGFGLPVLEALACGAPVITGDNSSLREIVSSPEALFDSANEESIRAKIEQCLVDHGFRARLAVTRTPERYTWTAVASATAEALLDLQVSARSRERGRRPRYALVSPLPPVASGIADYTERLLPHLRERVDLDVFADGGALADSRTFDITAFAAREAAVGGYDEVLFALGNSTFHHASMELLQRRGGLALFHDVRMSGLFRSAAESSGSPLGPGGRAAVRILDGLPVSTQHDAHRLDSTLIAHAATAARRVLVHSSFARGLAVFGGVEAARTEQVTFGFPDVVTAQRIVPGTQGAHVVSLGIVAETKQSSKVLEAFCLLGARHTDWHLSVVGAVDPPTARLMQRRISEHGVANVVVTGEVSDEAYRRATEEAALAVQLRGTTNGETSAAVADCLAASVPVVVTAIGAQRELPQSAIELVDREITAEALAEVVERLVQDPDRRQAMADAGRQAALDASPGRAAQDLVDQLKRRE